LNYSRQNVKITVNITFEYEQNFLTHQSKHSEEESRFISKSSRITFIIVLTGGIKFRGGNRPGIYIPLIENVFKIESWQTIVS
jgi:hypothetical protein